ncbi:MAG: hypothetical protein M3114_09720, partial [Thermoproteota archaeon]|nr:hypothetical protein [Thermoproteota archaeon]
MTPKVHLKTLATRDFYAPWSDDLGSSLKMTSGKCHEILIVDWDQFKQFLLQEGRTNAKTTGERIRYAKQFVNVLQTGDAQPLVQVTPDKRIHAMKGLASLSRFLGCYDTWLQIRQRYNLKWSTGNENLAAFQRFFDDSKTLDTMLQWVREAVKVLPEHMAAIIKFNVLTGLRPAEAIQAVRLLNTTNVNNHVINIQAPHQYYNPERQALEHFRFPEIFLRRTKSAYISIIELEQLSAIAQMRGKTTTPPTYEVLRFRLERSGVKCHLGYCRKIFGSWLR